MKRSWIYLLTFYVVLAALSLQAGHVLADFMDHLPHTTAYSELPR